MIPAEPNRNAPLYSGGDGAFRAALTQNLERADQAGHLRAGLCIDDCVTLLFGVIQSLVLRLIVSKNPAVLVQNGERLLDLQLMLFESEGNFS